MKVSTYSCLYVFFMCISISSHATTMAELQQQNRVAIKAWVAPQTDVAVKQQIKLMIEVSTVHWFAGGTRIAHVDVENAIVLHRDKLASNSSERRGVESWAVQQWELMIYPQKSGEFIIPPIPLQVSIAATPKEKVTGTLITPPVTFSAKLPSPYLTEDTLWTSATALEIEQQWNEHESNMGAQNDDPTNEDQSVDNIIQIEMGDAITRKIVINAEDSTAVMLPNIFESSTASSIDKAQLYLSPSQFEDSHSRGDYFATRIEEATWMVQEAGIIELPELTLKWWDTEQRQLNEVILPGKTFNVVHTPATWLKAYGAILAIGFLTGCLLLIVLAKLIKYLRQQPTPNFLGLVKAALTQNSALANLYLYRRVFKFYNTLTLKSYEDTLPSESATKRRWSNRHSQWQQRYSSHEKSQSTGLLLGLGASIKKRTQGFTFSIPLAIPEVKRISENSHNNDDLALKKTQHMTKSS